VRLKFFKDLLTLWSPFKIIVIISGFEKMQTISINMFIATILPINLYTSLTQKKGMFRMTWIFLELGSILLLLTRKPKKFSLFMKNAYLARLNFIWC